MDLVIQVAEKDRTRAFYILARHSPGRALPNRTYVVSREAAEALRRAGVDFTQLSPQEDHSAETGVASR